MAKPKVDPVLFSAAFVKAQSAEDVLAQFPQFGTADKVQNQASYLRHKGAALPYIPSRPGGKVHVPPSQKGKPKKQDLRFTYPTDVDPEVIYAAAAFDLVGTLEGYRKVQGAAPALRCRMTTTKLCALERVHKSFGGEIKQLNGAYQLHWPDEEQQHAFLVAIHGQVACDKEMLQAAQQFLEANVYQQMAGDNLVKVFKIDEPK